MKIWDGVIREGHSIMFDGKVHYEIPPPEGGYGPYKVWSGGKYVALVGKSQYELLNDKKFWRVRLAEQRNYISWLCTQTYAWSGRMQQLLTSAMEVLDMIEEKIKSHEKSR